MLPDKLLLPEKGAGDFGWGTQVGSTQESEDEVGPISGLVWSLSHSVPREGRGLVLGSHLKNKPNKAEVARTGSGETVCVVFSSGAVVNEPTIRPNQYLDELGTTLEP